MSARHILVLGGDGYLGWPTAMHFSAQGHTVTVVDNYLRRDACRNLCLDYLYPVPSLHQRARLWKQVTGHDIRVIIADLSQPEALRNLFSPQRYEYGSKSAWPGQPDAIFHYAEQPSAPYSHLDYKATDLTIVNNLRVTSNLLCAVRDFAPDAHIIHIGTMGEYGTPNIDIEEGWITLKHKGREDTFLFPRQAGSVYHTTKIMDTDLMWLFVRQWGLRITDLMQGPVYGIETEESRLHEQLRPHFNYDHLFGTVINRFTVQAVAGHPLTVYGQGGQTRGYIHIEDTLQCVGKAFEFPAVRGELRIFNQVTETFSVSELAERVRQAGAGMGLPVTVQSIPNPRKEAEEHYYNPAFQGLRELGVTPHPLTPQLLHKQMQIIQQFSQSIQRHIFL